MGVVYAIEALVAQEGEAGDIVQSALSAWLSPQWGETLTFAGNPWHKSHGEGTDIQYEALVVDRQATEYILWRYTLPRESGTQRWQQTVVVERLDGVARINHFVEAFERDADEVALPWMYSPLLFQLLRFGGFQARGTRWDGSVRVISEEGPDVSSLRDELLDLERGYAVAVYCHAGSASLQVVPERLALELLGVSKLVVFTRSGLAEILANEIGGNAQPCPPGGLQVHLPAHVQGYGVGAAVTLSARGLGSDQRRLSLVSAISAWHARSEAAEALVEGYALRREAVRGLLLKEMEAARRKAESENADVGALLALADTELAGYKSELADLKSALANERHKAMLLRERLERVERDAGLFEYAGYLRILSVRSTREAVECASELFGASLYFLPTAFKSAADSRFEKPDEVLRALCVLAEVAGRHLVREGQASLGEMFRRLGQDYAPGIAETSSARVRRQHEFVDTNGSVFECYEHLRLGVSYDPRYCLRIYFASKPTFNGRFVVGYVGKHLETSVQRS